MTDQFFFYRRDGILARIKLDEILFMEVADNYVRFHTVNQLHIVRTSLEAAVIQLPADRFVQIHRSYAVAIDQIDMIGKDIVTLPSIEVELPVSKTYYDGLMSRINIIEGLVQEGGSIGLF